VTKEILVVDDAPEMRVWLKAVLQNAGWNVVTAADGLEACKLLDEHEIQLVVTDWMMPNLDGPGLIESIRGRKGQYVYTILMTTRAGEDDSLAGLAAGADDYMVKPTSAAVLLARTRVAERILNMQRTLLEQRERVRESRDLIAKAYAGVRSELKQAARQQQASLPSRLSLPQGVEVDWRFRPASNLSGDHLDVFPVGDNRLVFYLLDVSGHGVSAALRSSALAELLRPISSMMSDLLEQGPQSVLDKLNRHMCESSEEIEYLATLALGVLDTRTGHMEISSAGHPSPFIVGPNGRLEEIAINGLPLGVMAETRYDATQARLRPGDALMLFSDGVTDCLNSRGDPYGYVRFRDDVEQAPAGGASQLVAHVDKRIGLWRENRDLEDDMTVLAVSLAPDSALTIDSRTRPEHSGTGQ
jgi:sigma-B regulation protein RsbU (phosphoserine phosphatase)